MSNPHAEDELVPTQTEGYKVGEKKTIEQYKQLDANDESLNRWKQSLGLGQSSGPVADKRQVVIHSLALEVSDRPDVVMDLSSSVDKTQEMIGSYGPSDQFYEKKFLPEEAPKGMMARGNYKAKSKFIDDDNVTHAEWDWYFEIKKDWQ
ncbi:rho GDP dissociation inhibitor [Dimargaris verticillata]|uniref:Rho GDP dissociation inhibitor n=1 Tax=Dimargaris verticillata TaxID=2761393 RepID=A0A9W8EEG4_9FUNG|nr:rho GDP dissociation inhibitor [Dimargaris verticillata]